MLTGYLLCIAATVTGWQSSSDGWIGGIVVNESRSEEPVAGATVVLQIKTDGDFVLLDQTTTDAAGRYLFRELLVSPHVVYKASAHHAGIHYPGPVIRLSSDDNTAGVTLKVRDTVASPSPLRVKSHRIEIQPSSGQLAVTETLLIDNPTALTFVGESADAESTEPTTLQLSIPADFQKVTFQQEFFGRRFAVHNGRLVTSLPWEPGAREVKFTYFLRNTQLHRRWERTLDLPTDLLELRVATTDPDEVTCNLRSLGTQQQVGSTELRFVSGDSGLPAQYVIECELGRLPVPWTTYAKWGAAMTLGLFVVLVIVLGRRATRSVVKDRVDSSLTPDEASGDSHNKPHRSRTQRRRRAA
jgi:hypothetical protein